MRLQVGHQQGSGRSFSGNIANDQSETLAAEIEEVVVIAAHLACLDADAGIFESRGARLDLGKKPGLNLSGILQFLSFAAIGLDFLAVCEPLLFYLASDVVTAEKRERV